MKDEIAYRSLECVTMSDPGMLQRMATRYTDMVREHAYLVGLMSLAVRTGDIDLLARTKKRLAQTELECNECCLALRVPQQEPLSVTPTDAGDRLGALSQTCEYATA